MLQKAHSLQECEIWACVPVFDAQILRVAQDPDLKFVFTIMLTQRDILSENFTELGRFGTVTAIHLLEHLAEEDMPTALDHLLQVTKKRLLIAVPYEEQAQKVYEHRQVFTAEKLRQWGSWCVQKLKSNCQYSYGCHLDLCVKVSCKQAGRDVRYAKLIYMI